MKKIFFLFSILLLSSQVFGQRQTNISLGFGIPEVINLGIQQQARQAQIGFGLGYMPAEEKVITISGNAYGHFGKLRELSTLRPWYVGIGTTYMRIDFENEIDNFFVLYFRFGRDINISRKIGIGIDAGPGFSTYTLKAGPCFGIRVFYKLYSKATPKSNE